MQVSMLTDVERRPRKVAVGEFDGVHLGHREVIAGSDTVLTFEPHPLQVVRPEAAPRLLTSFETTTELIAGLGVEGDRRGRTLGFPTANIVPDEKLVCPGQGVYVARADGTCAAVNVGVRPTFGTGRGVLVEAYLLDREVDLYGQVLRVEFRNRLRGERRFESIDALVEQMHRDVERTRELC